MTFPARPSWALRLFALAALLATSLAAFGQAKQHPLTNGDVVKMVKNGFADDVVVAMVEANDTDFDVSMDGITALKQAGISDKVLGAMLKAEARKRQAGGGGSASTQQAPATAPSQAMMPSSPMMGGSMGNSDPMQQMMQMAMSMRNGSYGGGGMPGMLDTSQLPPLVLLDKEAKQPVKPSIAQIASTQTKGDSMPGAGSEAAGMLMGLGRQALSFGAIGGSMFAGPAAGMAMGMMGSMTSMTHHHGPPKVTYVWALPGPQAHAVIANAKPRFEMSYGNLLGIDPDAYEPQLIRLVGSKDNWRLVGATKTMMGQIGTEAYEKVTEVRIAADSNRLTRGQVQIEPKKPLEPGEYAVVLRAIHPGKRAEGSLGGGAETSIFFSVWDFSIASETGASKP
jgi:hypothetical protein